MRISICIPQYNRSRYLIEALKSIVAQTYGDIEVVVSDDCSTDDTATVIPEFLEQSGLNYKYLQQPKNLGYDANLRAALGAGSGDYLFILGNDDTLSEPDTIERVVRVLQQHRPAVAYTNYYEDPSRTTVNRRARATTNYGGGVDVALLMYRAASFVSAVIFERETFHRLDTDRFDGSIYVQMYMVARAVAEGGSLLSIDDPTVVGCTVLDGERSNSFDDRLHEFRWKIRPATGGLDQVGHVVCEAILPSVPEAERQQVAFKIYRQLLMFSYPHWLHHYRDKGEFWASLNLALGCVPASLTREADLTLATLAKLSAVYATSTAAGLMIPVRLLPPLKRAMKVLSRRIA